MQRPEAAPRPGPPVPSADSDGTDGPGRGPLAWPAGRPPPGRPGTRLRPTRREAVTALAVVAGMVALGLAVAALWVRLSPRLEFRVVRPGVAVPVVPEAEEYIAADGRFVLLTLAAGVLAGLLCWASRRTRGPLVLLALAAGGLAGAVVAWRVGLLLGPGYQPQDLQDVGRTIRQPIELGALAALVVEPFAAVAVYLLGAGFSARNDLGRDDAGSAERPTETGHRPYAQPVPYRAEPYRAEPYRAEPYRAEPYRAEPYRAEPYRAEPYRAEPYQAEPYRAEPYQAEPYRPDEHPRQHGPDAPYRQPGPGPDPGRPA